MKRLLLLLPIIAMLAFTSCSSDDNNSDIKVTYTDDDIIGTWYFVRTYVDGKEAQDQDIYYPESYDFKANGTLEVRYDDNDVDLAKWKLNDDKLTVSLGGESQNVDVIISNKNMSIFYKIDYYDTGDLNDVEDQLKR